MLNILEHPSLGHVKSNSAGRPFHFCWGFSVVMHTIVTSERTMKMIFVGCRLFFCDSIHMLSMLAFYVFSLPGQSSQGVHCRCFCL